MTFRDDTRGASIPVTHAMTIGITALLLVGLLVGAGSFLNGQQQTVARGQLAEIGGDLANTINGVDRLAASGETVTASVNASYPQTVAGAPYTVELQQKGSPTEGTLLLDSRTLDRPIRIPVSTDTEIYETTAQGDSPRVRLCESGGNQYIALRECPP